MVETLDCVVVGAGVAGDRTWMVGDSFVDHQTAAGAGARCCLTAFGFGFETFPEAALTPRDWVVRSPDALLARLERSDLDVVVCVDPEGTGPFEATPLLRDDLAVYAPPGVPADTPVVTPEERDRELRTRVRAAQRRRRW